MMNYPFILVEIIMVNKHCGMDNHYLKGILSSFAIKTLKLLKEHSKR